MKKETISNALSVVASLGTAYVICDWLYEKGRQQGISEGKTQGYVVGKLAGLSDCLEVISKRTNPETKEKNESEEA